jgi:hypothetical protein
VENGVSFTKWEKLNKVLLGKERLEVLGCGVFDVSVHAATRRLMNSGGQWEGDLTFKKDYVFMIAMENEAAETLLGSWSITIVGVH